SGCVDPRAPVIYLGMGVFGYASDTCLRLGRAHSMTKKQIVLYGLAAVVLAVLVYMQFRTWRNFDWPTFWSQTDEVNKSHILRLPPGQSNAFLLLELLRSCSC